MVLLWLLLAVVLRGMEALPGVLLSISALAVVLRQRARQQQGAFQRKQAIDASVRECVKVRTHSTAPSPVPGGAAARSAPVSHGKGGCAKTEGAQILPPRGHGLLAFRPGSPPLQHRLAGQRSCAPISSRSTRQRGEQSILRLRQPDMKRFATLACSPKQSGNQRALAFQKSARACGFCIFF